MIEGRILKYYREKKGYTQQQLAEGVCSVTHLSKIERGLTEYSKEITTILSKKLNINIQDEVRNFKSLESEFQEWKQAIVMLDTEAMNEKKAALDDNELKEIPDFHVQYSLLLARHYLVHYEIEKCQQIVEKINKLGINFSPYERNLFRHVKGIYYFSNGSYKKSIEVLKEIDSSYSSEEYYYHLAISYHAVYDNILAFYYAQKALRYFQETLNFTRILDTETLIILKLNAQSQYSLEATRYYYSNLIQSAKKIQSVDRLTKLYYNFGQELYRRKHYEEAKDYVEAGLTLMTEESFYYLIMLDLYISICYKGNLKSKESLLSNAKSGLQIAKKRNDSISLLFNLHVLLLKGKEDAYYEYVENEVLPHFNKTGNEVLIQHYEVKLFRYYIKSEQNEKALALAKKKMLAEVSYLEMD
ncbi:transcriptional regulator with XRE-family HTH domain [Bacillus pakistanensis]|uniref:Transcriptional regulator with XRE-family HTH domain n=1 Tax=Rossellomorea pakistanensis TaxID=992288 RepID=A0ABS2NK56_9BACI|nr:helix-turn-helix transcriptional regulator [Bacillus pakistanensis]MBM7588139.1 transcriptional regulator with XRE-family HTH domain [Bacillus pakistanensis]